MNPRILQIQESITIKMADLAREIEQGGGRVIKLQTGDPDFATPEVVINAAHEAMKAGYTHYVASRGLPELREALATKLRQENGCEYNPDTEILVTQGAAHAIFITMQAVLQTGDEVLLIEPYYMSYASSIRIAGGVPVMVPTEAKDAFALDLERVRLALTERSRMLVLNSPCNPTGIVLAPEEVRALAKLAAEHDLFILCDEVYEKLIYDDARHTSVASLPDMRSRTITINSFSKTYAMTGWRLGYVAAPAELISQMIKVFQYSATCVAPFVQKAATVALTTPRLADYIEVMRQTYDRRRQAGLAAVAAIDGLRAIRPRGAFYLMVDISNFSQDSVGFAFNLLNKAHISLVPGASFGKSAEGWVRLTFAVPEQTLVEGIQRLGKFVQTNCE